MIAAFAILLAVAAEALVGYAIAELMGTGFDPPGAISFVTFIVVGLVAFALPRATAILRLSTAKSAVLAAACLWLFLYAPVHIQTTGNFAIWDFSWIFDFIREPGETLEDAGKPIVGVILLLAVWARSMWRSTADIELEGIPRSLMIPFAVVTVILLLAALTDRAGEVARAALGFYGVALLALACSQLALSGATYGDLRAGGTTAIMLAVTAVATLAGVVVFGPVFALSVDLLRPVVTGPVASGVEIILLIVLTPPIWVLSVLFDWIIGDVPFAQPDPVDVEPVPNGDPLDRADEDGTTFGDILLLGLRLLLVLGGISAVALMVLLLARLRRRTLNEGVARPESERTGSPVSGLFGFLGRRRAAASAAPVPDGPASRLYIELLHAAHERGVDRHPARTPREFVPSLEDAFHDPVTAEITDAFVEERYAGRPLDEDVAEHLRRRWREHRT